MKKIVCLILVVVMMATLLCGCAKEFFCESCQQDVKSKSHKVEFLGMEMEVCDDCYADYKEAMDQLGDLDLGDLMG